LYRVTEALGRFICFGPVMRPPDVDVGGKDVFIGDGDIFNWLQSQGWKRSELVGKNERKGDSTFHLGEGVLTAGRIRFRI